MKKNLLTFAAVQAVAVLNPDGFTISVDNLQPVTSGYAVAVAETQNSFNASGLKKVIRYAKQNKNVSAVGGWFNSENKKYYFDAVIICDKLSDAVAIGKANKQIAIFNLNTLEEIRL